MSAYTDKLLQNMTSERFEKMHSEIISLRNKLKYYEQMKKELEQLRNESGIEEYEQKIKEQYKRLVEINKRDIERYLGLLNENNHFIKTLQSENQELVRELNKQKNVNEKWKLCLRNKQWLMLNLLTNRRTNKMTKEEKLEEIKKLKDKIEGKKDMIRYYDMSYDFTPSNIWQEKDRLYKEIEELEEKVKELENE